ncbi:hypothetical protein [uncultured Mediterranean phage uvMED]|nr:hypothetical protein [uncultured Mediterranean phage uvMED]
MIYCKALKQRFDNKEEMFRELKKSKDILIDEKKSKAKNKKFNLKIINKSNQLKSEAQTFETGSSIYAVMNSTNVLDSHDDVSLDGSWKKTTDEQKGKVTHAIDHNLGIMTTVAPAKDVKLHLLKSNFRDLGYDSNLDTELLIFESKISPMTNERALLAYKEGITEHSIRLRYITVKLALNSDHEEDVEEKSIYDKHINRILNKEQVEDQGYFFAIYEQAISQEGSTVLNGSNSYTPSLTKEQFDRIKNDQPFNNTGETTVEPSTDTHTVDKQLLKQLLKQNK